MFDTWSLPLRIVISSPSILSLWCTGGVFVAKSTDAVMRLCLDIGTHTDTLTYVLPTLVRGSPVRSEGSLDTCVPCVSVVSVVPEEMLGLLVCPV